MKDGRKLEHDLVRRSAPASQLSTRWLVRQLLAVHNHAGGLLLDVGCGEAPYRGHFPCSRHVACDWPRSLHDRRQVEIAADASRLPFQSGCAGTVLLTEVIEHVISPAATLAETHRVLRPGGILILSAPFIHWLHEAPHDHWRFTEFGLRRLLQEAGFELVELRPRGGSLTVWLDVSARFSSLFWSSATRLLRFPLPLRKAVLNLLVRWPLCAASSALFFLNDHLTKLARFIDPPERLTLGFVVVARKLK